MKTATMPEQPASTALRPGTVSLTVRRTPTPPRPSERVTEIAVRYGLDPTPQPLTHADGLAIPLGPETITLLTGPSGTGKSALLEAIQARCPAARRVDRILFPTDRAVVDAVAPRAPLRTTLSILTACALSEPRLWLRHFPELSAGEQFRALLARAIGLHLGADSNAPLLCDEFAAVLHRRAAKAIAFNLRKLVTAERLCLVVATSHDDLATDLRPDVIIRTADNGPAQVSPAQPRRSKTLSLDRRLRIEPGRKGDYDQFAPMHYRQRDELGFVDRVYLLREGIGGPALGIIVYAHGPMELSLRNLATRRRFLRNPARLNREVRIIRRIVVHPDVRGCGLGHRLIRETMPLLGVNYVECLAAMGAVNPVFERAGMKRIGLCPIPANRARILEKLAAMHVDPFRPDFVTRVGRRPALRRLVTDAVYDWYRASTGGGESRVLRQSPRYLAETFRQMLGSRPVYYLWCKDHETHEQLTVASPDAILGPPTQTRSAHTSSPARTDRPRRSA